MSDTQITLEFLANTDGLKAAAQQMQILGNISKEQYAQFKKLGEENSRLLASQQNQQRKNNDEVKQAVSLAQLLSNQYRQMPQTITVNGMGEMVKSLTDITQKMDELAAAAKGAGDETSRLELAAKGLKVINEGLVGFQDMLTQASSLAQTLGVDNKALQKDIEQVSSAVQAFTAVQKLSNNILLQSEAVSKVSAAAQKAYSIVVGESTGVVKVFRMALATIGIGAVITGIVLLVENWESLRQSLFGVSKEQNAVNIAMREGAESVKKEIADTGKLVEEYKAVNTSKQRRIQIIEQLKQIAPAYFGALNAERTSVDELNMAYKRYIDIMVLKAQIDAVAKKMAENRMQADEVTTRSTSQSLTTLQQVGSFAIGLFSKTAQAYYVNSAAIENNADETTQLNKEYEVLSANLNILEGKLTKLATVTMPKAAAATNKLQKATGNQQPVTVTRKEVTEITSVTAPENTEPVAIPAQVVVPDGALKQFADDLQKFQPYIDSFVEASNTIFNTIREKNQRVMDEQLQKLQKQKEDELSNKNLSEQQKMLIEDKYRRKMNKIKLDQFEKDKQMRLAEAVINGMVALTSLLRQTPPPNPMFFVGAAIIGLQTGLAVANIASQKPPAFARGGKNIPAGMKLVGEQGPELIWTPGGETVIPHGDTAKILEAWSIPVPNLNPALKTDVAIAAALPAGIDYNKLAQAFAQELRNNPSVNISMDNAGFAMHLLQKNRNVQLLNNRYSA